MDTTGLHQELCWREEHGGRHTYLENRWICGRRDEQAFVWTWKTRREALRDHRLVKSPWSMSLPDGRTVNYHGLGLRLPWSWAFGHDDNTFSGVEIDGRPVRAMEACGTEVPRIRWWGRMDGFWDPPRTAVTVAQAQAGTWFVLKGDFAYLSVGPSNANECDIPAGHIITETYTIRVEDLPRHPQATLPTRPGPPDRCT